MTEKLYGGEAGFKNNPKLNKSVETPVSTNKKETKKKNENKPKEADNNEELSEKDSYVKAGKIAREVINFSKEFIKKDMKLIDIAEKIEAKITELGGKPAFPVNLSIDEVAAHSTPSWNDTETAKGLLKVDLGVSIEGYVADTAFSIDLENTEQNKKLIDAAEKALNEATNLIKYQVSINQIGAVIEKTIKKEGFQPIQNLSGHSIERYNLHAGITIPNYDNSQDIPLDEGIYAIEPFSTNGLGSVRDGKPSGIFQLQKDGNVRDSFAREVLAYIAEEYATLPFCSRWIVKKFGTRSLIALKRIEEAGLLHNYSQLIEKGKGKVAQAEHTIIISNKDKIITTL